MTETDNKIKYENIRAERKKTASEQQRQAADPNYSVWVEASAGTGKTKVLSDRVLRLLFSGVKPNRLLCLTYTKAAAAQMKDRISKRLSEWSVASESDLDKSLDELFGADEKNAEERAENKKTARTLFAELLDTPGGLKIQTIHSFCQEILKRFPLEADVTPYFEVMDDSVSNEVLNKIRLEILHEAESESDSQTSGYLHYLTANLSEKDFPKIMKTLLQRRREINDIMCKYADFSAFETALAKKIGADKNLLLADLINQCMKSVNLTDLDKNIAALMHGSDKSTEKAKVFKRIKQNGMRGIDFDEYCAQFFTKNGTINCSQTTGDARKFDDQAEERMQAEALRLQEVKNKITKQKLFFASQAVFGIANEINKRYGAYKKESATLDFNDLIDLTEKLLSSSDTANWVLYKLDGGIDHILVDEAQDTSPSQWRIMQALSGEFFAGDGSKMQNRTIFAVGDRKQSIFSFQGADPDKFDEMAKYFKDKAQEKFKKINLEVSFRSSAAVLDVVNSIFAEPEVYHGVTAEGEKVAHLPYRAGEYGHVEIWPLFVSENTKKSKDDKKNIEPEEFPLSRSSEISQKSQLAQAMAQKIKDLMAETKNSARPLHFKDFMVLFQKRANGVEDFVRACKDMDVNVSGADKLKLSEQIAVMDLISLGKFLLYTNDDLSLAEVLKSPLFGLTDDDLFKLCYNRGGASLWIKLCDNKKEYPKIYEQLDFLLKKMDIIRPYELYNYVLTKYNGRHKFIARMGLEVEDALDEFINTTIAYEREHIPSMQGFISWFAGNEIEVKRESEQNDIDAVRLMTVHHSKGLQARVVFLPDTVTTKRQSSSLAFLKDENLAYYPLRKDCYDENCRRLSQNDWQKNTEEYRRLMYVALTRAEDRLYICGYGTAKGGTWYDFCQKTLQNCGEQSQDSKSVYYETEEFISKKDDDADIVELKVMQPEDWINKDAPEEGPLAKPYTPSKLPEDNDETDSVSPLADGGDYYRRGTLIHKLLQFLPSAQKDRQTVTEMFLQQNAGEFTPDQKEKIKAEVLHLLNEPDFVELFGENSRAEVPVSGELNGKIISAQIDRLVILPDKIKIVDFKTNKKTDTDAKHLNPVYKNQLNIYAALIAKIYPAAQIETYILWTNEARLMRVS